jgi:hypothetical protein
MNILDEEEDAERLNNLINDKQNIIPSHKSFASH